MDKSFKLVAVNRSEEFGKWHSTNSAERFEKKNLFPREEMFHVLWLRKTCTFEAFFAEGS